MAMEAHTWLILINIIDSHIRVSFGTKSDVKTIPLLSKYQLVTPIKI